MQPGNLELRTLRIEHPENVIIRHPGSCSSGFPVAIKVGPVDDSGNASALVQVLDV